MANATNGPADTGASGSDRCAFVERARAEAALLAGLPQGPEHTGRHRTVAANSTPAKTVVTVQAEPARSTHRQPAKAAPSAKPAPSAEAGSRTGEARHAADETRHAADETREAAPESSEGPAAPGSPTPAGARRTTGSKTASDQAAPDKTPAVKPTSTDTESTQTKPGSGK